MKFFYLLLILSLPLISFAEIFAPFGGTITLVDRTCTNGLMLVILKYFRLFPGAPPTQIITETFMFQYGVSRLIVGQITEGAYTLGLALPTGACIKIICSPSGCITVPIPTNYTIHFIGTNVKLIK